MRVDLDDLRRTRPENVRRLARSLGMTGERQIERVRRDVLRRLARTQPPPPKSDPRFWFL